MRKSGWVGFTGKMTANIWGGERVSYEYISGESTSDKSWCKSLEAGACLAGMRSRKGANVAGTVEAGDRE